MGCVLGGREAGRGSMQTARRLWSRESPRLGGGEERVKDRGLALLSPSMGGEASGREGLELGSGPPQSPPDSRRLGPAGHPSGTLAGAALPHAHDTHSPFSFPRAISHLLSRAPASTLFLSPYTHTHTHTRAGLRPSASRAHLLRSALHAPRRRAPRWGSARSPARSAPLATLMVTVAAGGD